MRAVNLLHRSLLCVVTSFALLTSTATMAENGQKNPAAVKAAMKVLDEFMLAFNARDMEAWAATLNYPHVRFASHNVKVWADIHEFSAAPPFTALANIGWDHSHWLTREVVMASPAKVHIATTFERFNEANVSIGKYESLYIVTRVNDRWGIQARSSLAP